MQVGHYAATEVYYTLEHQGLQLNEIQDVSWDIDPKMEVGGKGLGNMKNTYIKTVDAPTGTWKLKRNLLDRADNGMLFQDILAGSKLIINEVIAAAATTYTVTLATTLSSIMEIRLATSGSIYREGVDFSVNYSTGVITFNIALPEAAVIRYLASNRRGANLIINGTFEDILTNTWLPFATGAIARNSANQYVGTYALAVTPAAASDGVTYSQPTILVPGRQYRVRLRAKAAAAETLTFSWWDGAADQLAAPASITLTPTYAAYEFTFTPTKASIANFKIKDTKAVPAVFYLDEIALFDDTTGNNPTLGINPMDGGLAMPFTFNIVARRVRDGVAIYRLVGCALDKWGVKSGAAYTEDISGVFLDLISE